MQYRKQCGPTDALQVPFHFANWALASSPILEPVFRSAMLRCLTDSVVLLACYRPATPETPRRTVTDRTGGAGPQGCLKA
jgi:hypothetical protein